MMMFSVPFIIPAVLPANGVAELVAEFIAHVNLALGIVVIIWGGFTSMGEKIHQAITKQYQIFPPIPGLLIVNACR